MENKLKSSVILRMSIIAMLTVLLLIPAAIVGSLISERESRRNEAVLEMSSKWGDAQHLVGPLLTIPFERVTVDEKGKRHTFVEQLHLLPDDLAVQTTLQPEIRYRGIYHAVLYGSSIDIQAHFTFDAYDESVSPGVRLRPENAFLTLGIRDLKGVKHVSPARWNEKDLQFDPGVSSGDIVQLGISTKAPLNSRVRTYSLSLKLELNGASEISFTPVGKETRVSISGPWGNPSFIGSFLPATRTVNPNDFSAGWKILNLNRNFPQRWVNNAYSLNGSTFGVKLLLPIDEYQQTTRAAKYAVMFIALSFLAFFLVEILGNVQLHPVHYSLVGFALLLFYVLLLSLSEYLTFGQSYVLAAVAVLALVAGYAKAILHNFFVAILLGALLALLYGFMYVILQMQDYALLVGSVGLFVILAVVMYLTRRIDWFSVGKTPQTS